MLASQESLTAAVAGLTCVLVLFATVLCVLIYMHLQLASRLASADAQQKASFDRLENLLLSRMHKLDTPERLKTKNSVGTFEKPNSTVPQPSSTSRCSNSDATSQTKRPSLQRSVSRERSKTSKQSTVDRARSMLDPTTQASEPQLKTSSSFIQYGKYNMY